MTTFTDLLKKKENQATFRKSLNENEALAHLGINITLQRKRRGLTQIQLGQRAGVSQQKISLLENGVNVETATLMKVCEALEISLLFKSRNVKETA